MQPESGLKGKYIMEIGWIHRVLNLSARLNIAKTSPFTKKLPHNPLIGKEVPKVDREGAVARCVWDTSDELGEGTVW